MGWLSALLAGQRSTLATPTPWLREAMGGSSSTAGVSVTAGTALGHPTVYACVSWWADLIGWLPAKVYRRMNGGGQVPEPNHPLYSLLHDLPNPEMTASEFKAAMQGHVELWGNAYAEVERDGSGRPIALWPLRPDLMQVTRDPATQAKVWLYTLPDGKRVRWTWDHPERRPSPILQIAGWGYDGQIGYSTLSLLRDTIGRAIAVNEFGARFFANNAQPGGVLEVAGNLTADQAKALKESWEAAHRGLTNSQRIAVLQGGVSWKQLGVNPDDAQFIETAKLTDAQIERIFRVPPHAIGDTERSTSWGTGIEQQSIGMVQYGAMPRVTRWEQAVARDLLSVKAYSTHILRFSVNALMRGDSTARASFYRELFAVGALSPNDILALEDMNGIGPLGDQRFVPSNFQTLKNAGAAPVPLAPPPATEPAPGDDDGTGTTDDPATD